MNKKRWLGLVGVIVAVIVYQMVNQADDGSNANGENSQAGESTSAVFESTLAEPTYKDVSVHDPSIIKVDDQYYVLGVNHWDVPFHGLIDEVKIFDGALSEGEVIALAE